MKTNKDLIFLVVVILYLTSNITSYILFKEVALSNFIWIILLATMVLVHKNYKFGNWLEKNIYEKY